MRVMMKWIEELLEILENPTRLLKGKNKFKRENYNEMITLCNS